MQTRIGGHLDEDAIEQYALHQLHEDLIPAFEEHLLLCEACQARLDEAEEFLKAGRLAAAEFRSNEHKRSSETRWSWLWTLPKPALAGALGAAVVAIAIPYLQQPTGPTQDVTLVATRGNGAYIAQAHPGRVVLSIDTQQLPASSIYRVDLVSASGAVKWTSNVQPSQHTIHATVPETLTSGSYWVRVYDSKSFLLREFGLNVQ